MQNTFTGTFIFVAHSHGDFDGLPYNNVRVSDGVRVLSFKAEGKLSDLYEAGFIPEQTKVSLTFKLVSKKEVVSALLTDIKKLKD